LTHFHIHPQLSANLFTSSIWRDDRELAVAS
jgi:hypothetical protein